MAVGRFGTAVKSDFVGLKREVVWTGFDGSRKVWKGKFKLNSEEGNTTWFKTNEGKVVILGPGWYSEEK